MNKKLLRVMMCSCSFVSSLVGADVPQQQVAEVAHLLAFVENSGCIINRNGSEHPAVDAIDHIKTKYDYFRDDISSTEDFIKLSAAKSTMSGSYYTVTCPGEKTIRTQDWLMTELKHFRSHREESFR